MNRRFWIDWKWREFLPGSVILTLALIVALASSSAAHAGKYFFAATLSLLALIMALVAGMILVPKLLAQVRWRILASLQLFTFTGLGIFSAFLITVIAIAALNTGNNLLILIVSALLVSYLVSGILAKLVLSGLAIGYHFPSQLFATRPAHFLWTLRNEKRWMPSFSLRAETFLESIEGATHCLSFYFPFLEPDRTHSHTVRYKFPRRGVYRISKVNLMTRFPFGFFQRGRALHPEREVLVYPEIKPIENFMHLLPFLQGERETFRKGQGESLYQIRDYQGGDSFRHIHWRSSAKVGQLMVRDFSEGYENQVCICLDNTRPHERFEDAVTLAASVASHFHEEGAPIQLVTAGDSSNPSHSRSEQLMEILEILTRARIENTGASFWDLISRRMSFVRPDEVFKIVITSAPTGSVPAAIWRTSHVVYFHQL
ncbi:MAG TPA: DUF58 domain-containing protein [Acidobacteriota bacterium]|jgi:uncharacterized protein (DUF58 family)|nr:DUF58 domain-containing protein [Acidobacteriota bacterium]